MGPISLQSLEATLAVHFAAQAENSAAHADAQRRRVRRRLFQKIRSGGPERSGVCVSQYVCLLNVRSNKKKMDPRGGETIAFVSPT